MAAGLALVAGCGGGGADSSDSTTAGSFACELGVPTEDGFAPLGEHLELELGFQGFVLVLLQVRAEAAAPEVVDATMSLSPEGADVVSGTQPLLPMPRVGDARVSDTILVFLTSNYVSYYVDRNTRVAVRLEGDGRSCVMEGWATLVDDDPCLHTGAEPICPDDTGYPHDTGDTGDTADTGAGP